MSAETLPDLKRGRKAKLYSRAQWAAAWPPVSKPMVGDEANEVREIFLPLTRFLNSEASAGRDGPRIVAVAGGVASGKSTFAQTLARVLSQAGLRVDIVTTDGFLFPNKILQERGLSQRKGFPESYDWDALRNAVSRIRRGETVSIPRYSHVTYDVDGANPQTIGGADIVILDGLHLARIDTPANPLLDHLIYLDAEEPDIERWFTGRLLPLMEKGRNDPNSFYHAFRHFTPEQATAFADHVWNQINLPNLRDHIVLDRDAANVVLHKGADHHVQTVTVRK